MKILVPAKRVPDTDQRIEVREDNLGIETTHLPYVINPFDAIAIEEAIRIRESGVDAEIVAVSVGDAQYEEQLRTALAMGADRAIRIDSSDALDPWNTASVLQALVKQQAPDLVLMGKQAVDSDCNQTGQFLAAMLDWPQATFASRIQYSQTMLIVDRETDAGIETVELPFPAVITTDLRLNEPRYASVPGIIKAKKKEIEVISMAELGIEPVAKIRTVAVRSEKTARKRTIVETSSELVTYLRESLQSK
ncbi:MAG: electron transfer flavoprotein subunit beta/FixA family protein [Bythopirellula sp.]